MNVREETIPVGLAEYEASLLLRLMGYDVTVVPEAKSRSCDLIAQHATGTVLVEVKTRGLTDAQSQALRHGESVPISVPSAATRSFRERLSDAAAQLAETASGHPEAIRLVWVRHTGPADDLRSLELFCTLYGVRWFQFLRGSPSHVGVLIPIFLADRSWFHDHPEVPAVVCERFGRIGLRVNPFAAHRSRLFMSRLFQMCAEFGCAFDLPDIQQRFNLIASTPEAVQRGQAAVLEDLQRRHGIIARPCPQFAECTAMPGEVMGCVPVVFGAEWYANRWELEFAAAKSLVPIAGSSGDPCR